MKKVFVLLIMALVLSGTRFGVAPTGGGGGDPTVGLVPTTSDGYANWSAAGLNAIPFSASIATSGTMTVGTSYSGALGIGQIITGTGVPSGETITAVGSGTGNTGTYTVSPSPSVAVSSEPMLARGIPNRCPSNSGACVYAT